jgi:hypothetical protein
VGSRGLTSRRFGALLVVLLVRFHTDVVDSNTSSITASTMSVNVAAVNNMVAALLSDIDEAILDQPRVNPNSPSAPVIAWADHAFRTIHQALTDLVPMLAGRLNDLEITPPSRQPTGTTTSGGATPGASTSTSKPAGRLPRCKKCHARGHDTDSCHTANPAAMRKRVAQNSRAARAVQAAHALVPSAPTLSHVAGSAYTAAPIPMEFAAIAADATELRRRAAQSRRDKRLRGRSSTSS